MFWKLLLAHFITDFVLQTKNIAKNKTNFKLNFIHCLTFLIIASIFIINEFTFINILVIIIISIFHGLIDFMKAKFEPKIHNKLNWVWFLTDQILHILIIIIVLSIFKDFFYSDLMDNVVYFLSTNNLFKFFTFFIIITFGGSFFTASVCKNLIPKINDNNSLENAGKYIGILERIIVATSIIIGRFEIIGFLIAAKSIIRYQNTTDESFTEYFLIGTFTSLIWAAGFTFLFLRIA